MNRDEILAVIQAQAADRAVRITIHARIEMDAEAITLMIVNCSNVGCPGDCEEREIEQTVHQGDRIIVVDRVPAEVCSVCGDILFTPETVERLEALRQALEPPAALVPLYHFHD